MYTWIAETFGIGDGFARGLAFAIALGIVLILIGLFSFVLKRLTGTKFSSGRSRQPRITVMDATNVDARRRLLLIRRDNVEHLILVGGPTDIVIEQGIIKSAPLAASSNTRPQASATGYPAQTQAETIADQSPPNPLARPVAPVPTRAVPPAQAIAAPKGPVAVPSAETRAATNAVADEQDQPRSVLNPARSLLQAAAAGRISPPFSKSAQSQAPTPSQTPAQSHTNGPDKGQVSPPPTATIPRRLHPSPGANPLAAAAPASPTTAPRQAQRPQGAPSEAAPKAPPVSIASPAPRQVASSGVLRSSSQPSMMPSNLAASRPNALSSHQVTPPSSGPAARARTAVQRPANGSTQTTTAVALPEATSALPDVKAETTAVDAPEPDLTLEAVDTDAPAELPKPAEPAASNAATGTDRPSPSPSDAVSESKTETPSEGASGSETEPAGAERAPDQASSEKPETENASPDEPVTEDPTETHPAEIADPKDADQSDPADTKRDNDKKAAPAGTPNPIEDEMAKLLDEIHGPQKQ